MHGLALNVSTELSYFESINPCGMAGCPVTSLENLLDRTVPMNVVKKAMRDEILRIFVSPES
jgi:lipoyl(octanoyl) transferase